MSGWLLSHLQASPGNAAVLAAAAERGLALELVAPAELAIALSDDGPRLFLRGDERRPPAFAFTRMGASAPPDGLAALRQLELLGAPCINAAAAILTARDKARSFQALAAAGLPLPATLLLGRGAPAELAERSLGPAPWIVKLPLGAQGAGVMIAESLRSLRSIIDTLRGLEQRLIVQRFIAEAAGSDVRVLVIGGRARAAMRRRSQSDDFRSNLHRGGSAEAVAIDGALAAIAEGATAALGLEVAGVDLLESAAGPVIIEVNASPGLEGIEKAHGGGLALALIDWLAERVSPC